MSRQIRPQSEGFTKIARHSGKRSALVLLAVILILLTIPTALILNRLAGGTKNDRNYFYVPIVNEYHDVKITCNGVTTLVRASGTVADAVRTAGIDIDGNDILSIPADAPISCDLSVDVSRVEVVETVELKTIDYATEYKEDDNYVLGYEKVVVDGEEGKVQNIVRRTYIDGVIKTASIISSSVTEPIDEVILKGTSKVNPIQEISVSQLDVPDYLTIDENGVPTDYIDVLTGKSCAYSADPSALTASGRQVMVGYVAVDPEIIPYGTELYIVSTDGKYVYGYAIAADTGTALLDGLILVDLFMPDYDSSCDWGAKEVNIYILK